MLPNLDNSSNGLRLSRDPGSQQVRDQGQVAELQKKHRTIKRLSNRSLGGELLVQKLLKSPLATGRNSVNRAHTAAGDTLLSNRVDEPVLLQLSYRVIQRTNVHIRVALDHGVSQAALDLIRVEIAPLMDAKN